MIPLFKVVSLMIRLFTRPISNYLKNSLKGKKDHHPKIKSSIVYLGQFYHTINIKIQRRVMNMSSTDSYVKPLPEEQALDSGAEFIGEIIAYGTLLIWGTYEINKFAVEAKAKEEKQSEIIAQVHMRLQGIEVTYKEILEKIQNISEENKKNQYAEAETETDEV